MTKFPSLMMDITGTKELVELTLHDGILIFDDGSYQDGILIFDNGSY